MHFDYDPMRLLQFEKFCKCDFEGCHCEGYNNVNEWVWDEEHSTDTAILSAENSEVKFHGTYSSGTAVARGTKPLEHGRHHYWEIKMMTFIYGTDNMVGVGTSKVDVNSSKEKFCSFLGLDNESFGYSYLGYIHHNNEIRKYGECFGKGSLVGIHLDSWRGTLEFFLNRKSLGIAFTGLKNTLLYPMVCSTAAHSKMKLICSSSMPVSLQMECLSILRPAQKAYLTATFPGLRYLSKSIFAEILQRHSDNSEDEINDMEFPINSVILDDFDFALVGLGRKKKRRLKKSKSQ